MFGPNLIASLTVSETLKNLLTVLPEVEIRREVASYFYVLVFSGVNACLQVK